MTASAGNQQGANRSSGEGWGRSCRGGVGLCRSWLLSDCGCKAEQEQKAGGNGLESGIHGVLGQSYWSQQREKCDRWQHRQIDQTIGNSMDCNVRGESCLRGSVSGETCRWDCRGGASAGDVSGGRADSLSLGRSQEERVLCCFDSRASLA